MADGGLAPQKPLTPISRLLPHFALLVALLSCSSIFLARPTRVMDMPVLPMFVEVCCYVVFIGRLWRSHRSSGLLWPLFDLSVFSAGMELSAALRGPRWVGWNWALGVTASLALPVVIRRMRTTWVVQKTAPIFCSIGISSILFTHLMAILTWRGFLVFLLILAIVDWLLVHATRTTIAIRDGIWQEAIPLYIGIHDRQIGVGDLVFVALLPAAVRFWWGLLPAGMVALGCFLALWLVGAMCRRGPVAALPFLFSIPLVVLYAWHLLHIG